MKPFVLTLAVILSVKVSLAAEDPHANHGSPPAKVIAADPHAAHKTHDTGAGLHADHEMPAPPAESTGDPASRGYHAADRIYGADIMAASRAALHHEHGAHMFSKVMLDNLEYAAFRGEGGLRWDGEAWMGGDINRAVLKTEGETLGGGEVEDAEVQVLYSRAIGPYFDLQTGLRYDIEPKPSRAYAALGIEGLAPYWFDVGVAAFVSDKGDLLARLQASYDQLITQRVVLEPRVELNFAAQSMAAQGIGRGLSDVELGLRLRYEIRREFAPYIGITFSRKVGASVDLARTAGDSTGETALVIGIRAWF